MIESIKNFWWRLMFLFGRRRSPHRNVFAVKDIFEVDDFFSIGT